MVEGNGEREGARDVWADLARCGFSRLVVTSDIFSVFNFKMKGNSTVKKENEEHFFFSFPAAAKKKE